MISLKEMKDINSWKLREFSYLTALVPLIRQTAIAMQATAIRAVVIKTTLMSKKKESSISE